jgi:hypothetical protein
MRCQDIGVAGHRPGKENCAVLNVYTNLRGIDKVVPVQDIEHIIVYLVVGMFHCSTFSILLLPLFHQPAICGEID